MSDRFRSLDPRAQFDAVVIGAGLGGLCAAAILSRQGWRVLVLDQHSVPGGNVSSFKRTGFEFDVGLHYVGDCGPGGTIPRALEEAGVALSWLPMDPEGFDTLCFPDGMRFAYPRGVERFEARLLEAFPGEARGIRRWCRFLRQVSRLASAQTTLQLLAALPHSLFALRHLHSTLAQVLDRCTRDARLRAVLCGPLGDHAVAPSRVSAMLHAGLVMHYLTNGAWYPKGGGQAMSDRLAEVIEAGGGKVLLLSRVERILVERHRAAGVVFRNKHLGERTVRAPVVISAADLKKTFLELLPQQAVPEALRERVRRYEMAPGMAVLYLGVRREVLGEAAQQNTNYWVFPGDDVEQDYAALREGRFSDEPTVFVTVTSARDPSHPVAPPGVVNLQVMALAPSSERAWGVEGLEGSYRRAAAYLARKRELRDRMLRRAAEVFPRLAEGIVFEELATPLTLVRYTLASNGTPYGLAGTPAQFNTRRPDAVTHLPGLFLAGASTRSAHGVAGALASGRLAARAAGKYLAHQPRQAPAPAALAAHGARGLITSN